MSRRIVAVVVTAAALALPAATASADTGKAKSPAKQCRAERKQLGEQAFKDKYGTNADKSNAFGKCVSKKAHEQRKQGEQGNADQSNGKSDQSHGKSGQDHGKSGNDGS